MECKHVLKLELSLIEQNILRAILGNIPHSKIKEILEEENLKHSHLNLPLDETIDLIQALYAVFTPAFDILLYAQTEE